MIEYKISFAGAGKVAGVLCLELYRSGHHIQQIVSEGEKSARELAGKCNARWSNDLEFPDSSEIIMVSVQDHHLAEVLKRIRCGKSTIIAHTAGSFGLEVFPERLKKTAVFYPLQTFSGGRPADLKGVPVFIESSDGHTDSIMKNLVKSIGGSAYSSDTRHREFLHIAAVFVSNFTNYILTAGKELSDQSGFPFEVLKPLIFETMERALDAGPENSQTGPAARDDKNTIEKHLDLLSFSPELKNIYAEITRSIIHHYKKYRPDEQFQGRTGKD